MYSDANHNREKAIQGKSYGKESYALTSVGILRSPDIGLTFMRQKDYAKS